MELIINILDQATESYSNFAGHLASPEHITHGQKAIHVYVELQRQVFIQEIQRHNSTVEARSHYEFKQ